MSCVAWRCYNKAGKKIPGITFHRFPKDENLKAEWVRALRRKNFAPSKYSLVCSNHFEETDFDRTSTLRTFLKPNSCPTVFPEFPKYLQKANKQMSCGVQKKSNAVVCSRHFTQKDFRLGFKHKFLLDTAIPSVFTKDFRSKKERMKLTPKKLSKKANPSKKSRLTSDKIIEQASTEMNQVSSPSIPRVMAVWSCTNNKTDSNLAVINEEVNNLPSYMKQALKTKAAIDKTYEDTIDAVASNSAKNDNLFPHPIVNNTVFIPSTKNGHKNTTNLSFIVPTNSAANPIVNKNVFIPATENGHKNISNLPYIVPTNSAAIPIVNNTVLIPATENGPKNITNLLYIVPTNILTSTVTEKVCDASTSTDFQDIGPKLNTQLERAKERNERQAKSNKTVLQQLRRCQKSLKRVKHSIFCELLDRRFMSNNADFNIDKEGCLFDRDSIRVCESADSESEEDELTS